MSNPLVAPFEVSAINASAFLESTAGFIEVFDGPEPGIYTALEDGFNGWDRIEVHPEGLRVENAFATSHRGDVPFGAEVLAARKTL